MYVNRLCFIIIAIYCHTEFSYRFVTYCKYSGARELVPPPRLSAQGLVFMHPKNFYQKYIFVCYIFFLCGFSFGEFTVSDENLIFVFSGFKLQFHRTDILFRSQLKRDQLDTS